MLSTIQYSMKSLALTLCLLASGTNALLNSTVGWPLYVKYETVTGYFLQDDPSTNATTFNYVRLKMLNPLS